MCQRPLRTVRKAAIAYGAVFRSSVSFPAIPSALLFPLLPSVALSKGKGCASAAFACS